MRLVCVLESLDCYQLHNNTGSESVFLDTETQVQSVRLSTRLYC